MRTAAVAAPRGPAYTTGAMPEILSARQAAARCGVPARTVCRWIAAGLLRADKRGGRFLVNVAELEAVVRLRRALGRTRAARR